MIRPDGPLRPGANPGGRPAERNVDMTASPLDRAARATPPGLARRIRGLSDRTIAWIIIALTILLLLAVNIFPLIWTVYLSFTNYR